MKIQVKVLNADKAKRAAESLAKRLEGHDRVLVGVQKDAGTTPDGISVADIATANHFGTDQIPARPYLDVAIEKNRRSYSKIAEKMIPLILQGKIIPDQMLDSIGQAAAAHVQEYIVELRDPPNSPITIARKGSDNPLIDTGHLRQSIRHEIAREPVEEGL